MSRLLRRPLAVASAALALLACAGALALTSLGGATPQAVGDTLNASGSLNDDGTIYTFNLSGTVQQPGMGDVRLTLSGFRLTLCTVGGGTTTEGSFPLTSVRCGFAGLQAVSIEGCKAEIQAHGYSHSDFPFDPIYNGTMTVKIEFEKTGSNSGKLKVTVYTPNGKNEVDGAVATGGPISMSTCP